MRQSLPIRRIMAFILEPLYVCKMYVVSMPKLVIPNGCCIPCGFHFNSPPIFSVGIGLVSIVPSVLMINKIWFAYPMSLPVPILIMVAYGRAAEGVYETQIA